MMTMPPIPRTIVATHSSVLGKALIRLILFAVIAGTLCLTFALLHELALRYLAHEVMATVTSLHEREGEPGSPWVQRAKYSYTIAGRGARTDESRISSTEYRRLSMPFLTAKGLELDIAVPPGVGADLKVRAYALGPLVYSRAVEHHSALLFWLIPAIFSPLGMMISLMLWLAIIVRPRRYRWLFSHGTAAAGTVTGRHTQRSRWGHTYHVQYTFVPAGSNEARVAVAMVPGLKAFEAAITGQAVTVLYDPEKPRRSAIYEYGGFRIV